MAQQEIQLDGGKLCCSICLDLLKDPVTIPCGHSYCMSCIKSCWDEEDQKRIHSCPQCRQTFIPRPVLVKSTVLAELVEDLKKTGLQAVPPDRCYAEPGDVACDVCTGRKLKSLKSCLVCGVSYCEQHLQPHYDVAPLKKHRLVEATTMAKENFCSRHDEIMKIFCRTDQQCICYICSMDEHKDHDTVSAEAERKERQKEHRVNRQKILQRVQDREEDMKVLQQEVKAINCSADKAVKDSEKNFTELVRFIEKKSTDVTEQIRSQQKKEVSRAVELQEKLKQEIAELKRKDDELERLSWGTNHIHFLLKYPSLSHLSESTCSPSTNVRPLRYFEDVSLAVSELRDKLRGILTEELPKLSRTVTEVDVLLPQPEPKTRTEFLKYSCQMTLDPNTAGIRVSLSEGNKKATGVGEDQLYSRHPDRFSDDRYCWQVLSREGLTGRCYWEVKWRGGGYGRGSVVVACKDISRTGDGSRFGCSDKSWRLDCYNHRYEFHHNNITTKILGPGSSTIGVYLDHRAGILSFMDSTMNVIHRVQTTFTQPLYAGLLCCGPGNNAEFIF